MKNQQVNQKRFISLVGIIMLFFVGTHYAAAAIVGLQRLTTDDWQFAYLDSSTGVVTALGDTLTGFGIINADTAFDTSLNRYYLNTTTGIQVIDSQTGELLDIISPVNETTYLEASNGKIYGVWNPAPYEWQFVSLDASTGIATVLGDPLTGFAITNLDSAFDASINRYYLNTTTGIQVIDSQTGALLDTLILATQIHFLEANNGKLYGVQHPATNEWQFVSLAPSTREVTPLGDRLTGFSVVNVDSAFDYSLNRYYLNSTTGIHEIDPQTGELLATFNVIIYLIEISGESEPSILELLEDIITEINDMDSEDFKNTNMQDTLIKKVNEAIDLFVQGAYTEALNKLQKDILGKIDGCATSGEPDNNDWIQVCASQAAIYPLVIDVVEYLENM